MKKFAVLMYNLIKKMFVGILAVGMLISITMFLFSTPTSYIHRKTEFWCVCFPERIYSYNAIDHGRDYNSLYIFKIKKTDAMRLISFAERNEVWLSLPVSETVLQQNISNIDYDVHMQEMLNVQSGFWYVDDRLHNLFVFDTDTNTLFIRTASVFITDLSDND